MGRAAQQAEHPRPTRPAAPPGPLWPTGRGTSRGGPEGMSMPTRGPRRESPAVDRPAIRRGTKIASAPRAAALVRRLQAHGRAVVFTNGCFDLLHAGHVALLAA